MKFKKKLQKVTSILLAIMMVFAMTATAFADTTSTTGSITINGVSNEHQAVYKIYKMLDLKTYNATENGYSYLVCEAWEDFFTSEDIKYYVTTSGTGYVTWNESIGRSDAVKAEFAKKALAYAKDNGILADQTITIDDEFVVTDSKISFGELELGYYLIDSTVGALCGLTTTNPHASLNAKNGHPTIDKQVQEDSTNLWGDENTADIGQLVYYEVTINVHAGAESYILHDKMSEGLTYREVSNINHVVPGVGTESLELGQDYTVKKADDCEDGCTFEVHFSQELCKNLKTNDKLIVYYNAMLNKGAVVDGSGNTNESWLEYGEKNTTTTDTTTTKTYGIDLVKTDRQNTLLNGAKFKIYDAATGGNEVGVVPLENEEGVYRRVRKEVDPETGVEIEITNGQVRIVGLDNGTYYLEEIEAPDGYNPLDYRVEFIISDANRYALFNGDVYSVGSGVQIVNNKGTMLPETGGIGTTIFYILGGLLVFGAVVLMVTKKRMNSND